MASLEMYLRQEMKLSPQLLQTVEYLTLTADEIKEKIRKVSQSNPVLVVRERDNVSYNTYSQSYNREIENSFNRSYSKGSSYDDEERKDWIEGMVSRGKSLKEHLLEQLGLVSISENGKKAAEMIITSLDKNGFLNESVEQILPEDLLGYSEEALKVIQGFDPVGIGVRNWRESLLLQLESIGCGSEELKTFKKLIFDELDYYKEGKTERIAKDLGTDKEDVDQMIALIKTLTPYPGLKYNIDLETYITPEVSIKKENGVLKLRINEDSIPLVSLDETYIEMEDQLKKNKSEKNKEALNYLKKQVAEASSIVTTLQQRNETLTKTAKALFEKQYEFFLKGPKYLTGLTMREIASMVGVHETTISRISQSKYIDTDWGIYPIRYLFSNQVKTTSGQDASKNSVKELIKEIIESNKTGKALSDQKIADALKEKGIEIARRTVNKYRKELDIESSYTR